MHSWLPAQAKRRIASLAAAFVLPAVAFGAMLACDVPAASAGTVSVAIGTMSPQYARTGSTVRLTGTVTNGTSQARSGLVIQLYTSAAKFPTRDQMDSYLTQPGNVPVLPAGNPFRITGSLRPGGTARWTASFGVADAGITAFGVYPLAAQVIDPAGNTLASDQTLLPFWPGSSSAAGLMRPLDVAWAWPLIDQPHQQACAQTLTSDDLAAGLGPGGRLSVLLQAGKAHPGADLTWFVDPALLSDAATMTGRYQVGPSWGCTGTAPEPASKAAARWLSALRTTAAQQQTVITSYANVDMTALVHQGLTADLGHAFQAGGSVARTVLHRTFRPSIAWPAGGAADLSVLSYLAATEGTGTVVLDSNEMPPTASPVYHGDDAVTSIRTGAGTSMNVLLADDTLTGMLRAASGALTPDAEFAVKQRFLAETAMIAAEYPNSARSVVVAPPQDWSPTTALANDLLNETVSTPWLSPATLKRLTTAQDTGREVSRQSPPASKASPGELGPGYLSQVATVGQALSVYQSMLYQPPAGYLPSLEQALAATESSAWRGGGQPRGAAMTSTLSQYLANAQKKVKIITSAQVPMGGASGLVPVNIQNGLREAIQVRLTTSVLVTPTQTSQLTIGRYQSLWVIQPGQIVTVRLPVRSAPIGSTQIKIGLTSADGTPLPSTGSLTVESTRYGRAILFLIGAAIGVLVLTSLYRGVRRWLHDDTRGAVQEDERPGSVVTGTSGARHPTEAPDDLADARRWADDA